MAPHSHPAAGSPPAGLRTRKSRKGFGWRIGNVTILGDGRKIFIGRAEQMKLRPRILWFLAVFSGMKSDVWSVIIGLANPNGIESCSPGWRVAKQGYPG